MLFLWGRFPIPMNAKTQWLAPGARAVALAVGLVAPAGAIAATDTWNGTTDSSWSLASNWDTGILPGTADTALFNNAGSGNTTINISNVSVGNITFDTSSAAAYTFGTGIGSGTIVLGDNGVITSNSTVHTNQVFDSNMVLGSDATSQSYWLTCNSGFAMFFAGTISGGTGGTAGTKTLGIGGTGAVELTGSVVDGGSAVGISKMGSGTLWMTGVSNYSGDTVLGEGILDLTGSITTGGTVSLNGSGGGGGIIISGGTLAAIHAGTSMVIGTTSGYGDQVAVSSGGSLTTAGDLIASTVPGSYGIFTVNGGKATINGRLVVGSGGDNGFAIVTGGSLTVSNTNKPLTMGSTSGSVGTMTVIGGTLVGNSQIVVGDAGSGALSIDGSGDSVLANAGVLLGSQQGSSGTLSIHGGILATPGITGGAGTTLLNLNGGTIQATADNQEFLAGVGTAYVYPTFGVRIDTNGHSIRIDQPLLAATGDGISASGLTFSGSFTVPPSVQLLGGNGTGAAATVVLDSSGALTGLRITSPGVNYTVAPTIHLVGARGAGAISGQLSLVPNYLTDSLTKVGAGTLTLSGANTFSQYVYIYQGALVADATTTASVLNPSVILCPAGGTFQLLSTSGAASQVLNGVRMTGVGQSVIDASNVGGGGTTIDLRGTSGTATIQYHSGGALDFRATVGGPLGPGNTAANILTHQQNDASGILGGYATVNGYTDWAANDGHDNIVPFTGYVDIPAAGGVISDGANTNVRINSAGTSGSITLGSATTSINTLLHNVPVAATIDTSAGTLHLGQTGGVLLPAGAGPLTIGTAVDAGKLTAGPLNQYGDIIISNNTSASTVTINSTITNTGTGPVQVIKLGPGPLTLASTHQTFDGGLQLNGGVTTIMGDGSLGAADSNVNNIVTIADATLRLGASTNFSQSRTFDMGGITGGTIDTQGFNATISGMLNGGDLTKVGPGTLTITSAAAPFTGTATISGGTLQIGDGTNDGTLPQSAGIVNDGQVAFNVKSLQSFPGPISGPGPVTKSGAGQLTLSSGTSSFSGPLNITAGTLLATGLGSATGTSSTGSAPVTVGPGGTLGGGTVGATPGSGAAFHVAGTVTLSAGATGHGGTVLPGTATTTANLTTGAETWNGGGPAGETGSVFGWRLNLSDNSAGNAYVAGTLNTDKSGANWDQLSMSSLDVNASASAEFNIQVLTSGSAGAGAAFNPANAYSWVVANVPAGNTFVVPAGAFVIDTSKVPASVNGSFNVSTSINSATDPGSDDIVISYSPLPEPTAMTLSSFGIAGVFVRRRRMSAV
jgi:autotransporter-associated beta strand protein